MIKRKTRIVSVFLAVLMTVSAFTVGLATTASAYSEVSNNGGWYTWGTMQSTSDGADLDTAYGNPVSSQFTDGEYVVTMDNTPNEAYRSNMESLAEWAKTAYATLPDGTTAADDVYGTDFWADYNNDSTYYGFRVPQTIDKTKTALNDIPVWYEGNSYTGNVYYACWTQFRNIVLAETSGNIASSISQQGTNPASASIGFKINTSGNGTGNCVDADCKGKFAVGFIPTKDFVNMVATANVSWNIHASSGLTAQTSGLYVTFGSVAERNDYYDFYKVTYNGQALSSSALDGWVESNVHFSARGDVEYTLFLTRTGGSADVNGYGVYSLYITDGTDNVELAAGISMLNSADLRYFISTSTPAYTNNSAENAGYTVTKVSEGAPENFTGHTEHNWDNGTVITEPTCSEDGTIRYTCTDAGCGVTKTETVSHETVSHFYGEWTVTTAPTCLLKGVKERACVYCGSVQRANADAMGHAFGDWQTVSAPTCTAPGMQTMTCANCGKVKTQYTEANGHTFGDWTVTTAATKTTEGEKTRICSVCGFKEVLPIPADTTPHVTAFNYSIIVEDTDGLNFIRIASGNLATSKDIKNAPDLISVDRKTITAGTENGVYRYDFSEVGEYSVWLRYDNGGEYIKHINVGTVHPVVTTNGVTATVHNVSGISDFFIAKGHYTTYREVNNNKFVRITANDIGDLHDFTYAAALPGPGEYTLWIRYADTSRAAECIYFPCVVTLPEFSVNGLQVTVENTTGARVIRIAPGEWNTPGEIKRAAGCRNFTAKQITASDSYTIQNSKDASGMYTISIEYTNGYSEVFKFNGAKKTPSVKQTGTTVTLGNLEGVQVIRYAPGVFTTATDIKNASGSEYIRPDDVIGYEAEIGPIVGIYTFLVQYTDNSVNIFTLTIGEEASGVWVSKAFSNDMIVQRDEPLSVWGWAPADQQGKIVTATFRGETAYGVVNENGEWKATFDKTFPASVAHETITVKAKNFTKSFTDVMTGDVYYVIGQSNVYWSISDLVSDLSAADALNTIQYDFNDSRNIRFFRNSNGYYANFTGIYAQGTTTLFPDVVANVSWMKPSDADVRNFSAYGYLTAYNLSNCVDVPIGMIEIDASGLELAAFTPNELNDKWGNDIEDTSTGIHYMKLGSGANTTVYPLKSRFAYNQQLYPLINFSTAGILWYQGESDYANTIYIYGKHTYTFSNEYAEYIEYLRAHMGNSDFPVYLMEFPAVYYNGGKNEYIATGEIRSEVGTIPRLLDNCYVLSSSDLWGPERANWWNNIHPYCKPAQALRACFTILATRFGIDDPDYVCGPTLESVEYTDANSVVLTFDHVGDGLTYADVTGTGLLYGFEVLTSSTAYSSGWRVTGLAKITAPNQITINENIPIYGVRYHATTEQSYPSTCNVSNSRNVPMIAFADYQDLGY